MKQQRFDSYEAMSRACADALFAIVKNKPDARVILATGYSPQRMYRLFVERELREGTDISRVTWIKLDEWAGLPPENKATCDHFLKRELFDPLGILPERIIAFDQMQPDLDAECRRIHEAVAALGAIDAAVLGVGKNGHVGLNEPSSGLPLCAHVAVLDDKTKTHAMLQDAAETNTSRGVTLGFGELFLSRTLLILATGTGKEDAMRALESGVLTTEVPATLLRLHADARLYIDGAAIG